MTNILPCKWCYCQSKDYFYLLFNLLKWLEIQFSNGKIIFFFQKRCVKVLFPSFVVRSDQYLNQKEIAHQKSGTIIRLTDLIVMFECIPK